MSQFTDVMTDIQSACSSLTVAMSAGFAEADWADLHVFMDGTGLIGGRNRGRLPFVEVIPGTNNFDWLASNYSTTDTFNVTIKVWVGGKDRYIASAFAQDICRVILSQFNNYPRLIDKQVSFEPLTIGPLGYSSNINLTINLSNDEGFR